MLLKLGGVGRLGWRGTHPPLAVWEGTTWLGVCLGFYTVAWMDHEVAAAPFPLSSKAKLHVDKCAPRRLPVSSKARPHADKCAPRRVPGNITYKTAWGRQLLVDEDKPHLGSWLCKGKSGTGCAVCIVNVHKLPPALRPDKNKMNFALCTASFTTSLQDLKNHHRSRAHKAVHTVSNIKT